MPKGPRNLKISFGSTTLTPYGGVYRLHRFLTRTGFKRAVGQALHLAERNNRYRGGERLLALLYPMILGLERIEATQLLRQNGVFQYLTGLPSYPEATSLRRFLLRIAPTALARLRALQDRCLPRMTLFAAPPARIIFDVGSTGLVVYGKQARARIGYNPVKRGRPSYHPLLCFDGQRRDCWHGEPRPGDAHAARGAGDLLHACFAKVPDGVRSIVGRGDKGFRGFTIAAWSNGLNPARLTSSSSPV